LQNANDISAIGLVGQAAGRAPAGNPTRKLGMSSARARPAAIGGALIIAIAVLVAAAGPSTRVRVTSIPALLTALANNKVVEIVVANGTYRVSPSGNKASDSLWIGARFAGRTNPVTVRAETTGGVTFDGGGTTYFGGITFAEGAHHQTWDGFRWANAMSSAGVIFFGGILDSAPPHHITLRNITVASVRSDRPNHNHVVYFSWAGGGGVHDILIDGLTADGAGGLTSAIHIYHSQAGNPNANNVTMRRLSLSGFVQAIIVWDATVKNIVVEDSTIANAARFAIRYEEGGTLTLRRIASTGSGDRGFYSNLGATPPGVTFDNCNLR